MTINVIFVGWKKGAKTVSGVLVIKEHTHIGLRQAKLAIENYLEGKPTAFEMGSKGEAEDFLSKLDELGFVGKLQT